MGIRASANGHIVKLLIVIGIRPRTSEQLQKQHTSLSRDKQEPVPIAAFLALVVIDVVKHTPHVYDLRSSGRLVHHCDQLINGINTIVYTSNVDLHLMSMDRVVATDHL